MISVVIPTYNRKDKLKRALKSVLNQTLKDIEIIIVDNGSSDGTLEFLNNLNNNIISFYINLEKGANYSRNLGIEKSKGEYVAFLDDDDEWEETKLEKQLNVLEQDKSFGLCYTGKKIIYENYGLEYISYAPKDKNINIHNYIGTTSSVLIRKSIFEKSGKFDVKLPALQDYDLWIRILEYTKSYEIKEALIKYYISPNNGQISNSIEKFEEAVKIIDKKNSNNLDYLKYVNQRKRKREKEILLKIVREENDKEINKIKNKIDVIKTKIILIIGFKNIIFLKKWRNKCF